MDEPTRRPAATPRPGDPATADADPGPGTPPDPGAHRPRRARGRHHDEVELDEATVAEIDQAAALAGSRVEHLVEELIETELETGRREETIEQAKRHLAVRIASVVAGVVVLILGIGMLVLPGPGLIVIALGLGLLATEVPFARRLLDKVRARLPQDEDGSLPRSTIITMVVVGVGAVALSIGFSVWRLSAS